MVSVRDEATIRAKISRHSMKWFPQQMVLAVLIGFAGVGIWIVLWGFYAVDQCLDLGGSVRYAEFSCVLPDSRVLPLLGIVLPVITILSVTFVTVPVLLGIRSVLRGRG